MVSVPSVNGKASVDSGSHAYLRQVLFHVVPFTCNVNLMRPHHVSI